MRSGTGYGGRRRQGASRSRRGPEFWLKAAMALAALLLVVLPFVADAVNAALRPVSGPRGDCRILSVIDGDTVLLWCAGDRPERARLTGFDTPELFSPGCPSEYVAAERAKWALRAMIFAADKIRVTPGGRDRYDRLLAAVTLDGVALADRMVAGGHARRYDGGRRRGWCGAG